MTTWHGNITCRHDMPKVLKHLKNEDNVTIEPHTQKLECIFWRCHSSETPHRVGLVNIEFGENIEILFQRKPVYDFCVLCVKSTKSRNGNIIQTINLHGHYPQLPSYTKIQWFFLALFSWIPNGRYLHFSIFWLFGKGELRVLPNETDRQNQTKGICLTSSPPLISLQLF